MDTFLYGVLPILIGSLIGIMMVSGTKNTNQKVVNDLKEKLDTVAIGDSIEKAIEKAGNPAEKTINGNVTVLSWDVHSQQKVLYKRSLEFVDNVFQKVVYENESV